LISLIVILMLLSLGAIAAISAIWFVILYKIFVENKD